MNDEMIRVSSVVKSFGTHEVLKGISLTACAGQITGLLGRNGCGKSVLMKCILGLMKADSGEIIVNGEKIHGAPPRTPIGFIVDAPGLLPYASAYQNLKIVAQIRNIVNKEKIEETLRLVGLDPASKKAVKHYSMGMQQRLGLAQALMEDPQILLLDEPLNGLDQAGMAEIRELLKNQAKMNKTILMTSHNQADIDALCDKKYTIIDGMLAKEEAPPEKALLDDQSR